MVTLAQRPFPIFSAVAMRQGLASCRRSLRICCQPGFSLITHTAKIIAKILRRRIERKIEAVLGEDQFGFRRGKGTRDAIGMMENNSRTNFGDR